MDDIALREHARALLTWEKAHAGFEAAVAGMPAELRGARPPGAAHSPWEVLEHRRLAQEDILAFARDPDHDSPPWPEGYWPSAPEPPSEAAWDESAALFLRDRAALAALVLDPARDLLAPLSPTTDATLLREALLAADHTAYHVAELVTLRRQLGAWGY